MWEGANTSCIVQTFKYVHLLKGVQRATTFKNNLVKTNAFPLHQFHFQKKHSTIEQVHSIVSEIRSSKYCSAVFWTKPSTKYGTKVLPVAFMEFLNPFSCSANLEWNIKYIQAGVPQGSTIGQTLYLIFTSDLLTDPNLIRIQTNPQVASNTFKST